jgi:hypothetical protein
MALETLGNRIDVKGLALETPEKENQTFDARKDISEKDWVEIMEALRPEQGEALEDRVRALVAAKQISPERIEELDPQLYHKIQLDFFTGTGNDGWVLLDKLNMSAYIESIYGDKYAKKRFSGDDWGLIDIKIESDIQDTFFSLACRALRNMRISYPEHFVSEWADYDKAVKHLFEALHKQQSDPNSYLLAAGTGADLKIAYPEPYKEVKWTNTHWTSMRKHLNDLRDNKAWTSFIEFASYMQILAAQHVEVVGGQLHVSGPETRPVPLENKESLPAQKIF